jgi:hypothetical protein
MINDNLIYNPSFRNGTTGWSAFVSGSIAAHTTDSFVGDACIKITKSSTTSDAGVFSAAGYKAIATAGNVYSASAYVKVPTGQETIEARAVFRCYDSGGSFLSATIGTLTTITNTDGWIRLTAENATAPTSTAFADVGVYQDSGSKTVGNYFLVDAVKLENSAIATQFVEPIDQAEETRKVNIGLTKVPIPHLTGMELNADIMLNELLLNTIDENSVVWVCSDIDGWWNLPDSDFPDLTRGLDDGSYDVRGRYAARVLTLTGSILPPNRDAAAVARNKLIQAINLIHTGGWLFVDESPTKAAYVRLSGRPSIQNTNARGRIDFSIGLRAANPVKFKWNWEDPDGYITTTVANGSTATIENEGNTDVPIVFTLTGGSTANLTAPITVTNTTEAQTLTIVKNLRAANYGVNISSSARTGKIVTLTVASHDFLVGDIVTIANVSTSGRTSLNQAGVTITNTTSTTITYTGTTSGTLASAATNGDIGLDSADTLVVDTYNKSALLNGSATYARSYIDAVVDWITLAPGDNTIGFTDSGGTTDMTVEHRSGWIG